MTTYLCKMKFSLYMEMATMHHNTFYSEANMRIQLSSFKHTLDRVVNR